MHWRRTVQFPSFAEDHSPSLLHSLLVCSFVQKWMPQYMALKKIQKYGFKPLFGGLSFWKKTGECKSCRCQSCGLLKTNPYMCSIWLSQCCKIPCLVRPKRVCVKIATVPFFSIDWWITTMLNSWPFSRHCVGRPSEFESRRGLVWPIPGHPISPKPVVSQRETLLQRENPLPFPTQADWLLLLYSGFWRLNIHTCIYLYIIMYVYIIYIYYYSSMY